MSSASSDSFKQGMRHLAASVNIVSTWVNQEPCGMLATAVCSVSAAPPTLLVCINRNTSFYQSLCESGFFCVNVMSETQVELAKKFLGVPGAERFGLCEWSTLTTGAPAITSSAANFDCSVSGSVDNGSHRIFLGEVVAVRNAETDRPLVYHDGRYASISAIEEPFCV
ncbi:flavin reductase family protein [uncultured Sneathiella sp.]|uniref:flavin reductase family protein n=1 Tax=uncultured Sneathiella sp. TaxID=879315 RepID=UPI0030EEE5F7|tara:strand:+ start:31562 stop:32065 length:504 start_codon:yes stop_codon:yes gene_type:complete